MKAILVMDMPSSCDKCPLFGSHYSDMTCRGNGRSINYPYPKEVRQDWCPLKPVPSKKKERYGMNRQTSTGHRETYGEKTDSVAVGYNACIDEILGDKE